MVSFWDSVRSERSATEKDRVTSSFSDRDVSTSLPKVMEPCVDATLRFTSFSARSLSDPFSRDADTFSVAEDIVRTFSFPLSPMASVTISCCLMAVCTVSLDTVQEPSVSSAFTSVTSSLDSVSDEAVVDTLPSSETAVTTVSVPVVVVTSVPSMSSSVLVWEPSALSVTTIFGMVTDSFSPHLEQVRSFRPSCSVVASVIRIQSDQSCPRDGNASVFVSPQLQVYVFSPASVQVGSLVTVPASQEWVCCTGLSGLTTCPSTSVMPYTRVNVPPSV